MEHFTVLGWIQVGRSPYVLVGMLLVINTVPLIPSSQGLESLKWCLVRKFSFLHSFSCISLGKLFLFIYFCFYSVPEDGEPPRELEVYDFKGPGIALAMYNVDEVGYFVYFIKLVRFLHHINYPFNTFLYNW